MANLFQRVPYPQPWVMVEHYEGTTEPGKFLYRQTLSLYELHRRYGFDPTWVVGRGFGPILSSSFFLAALWIKVKLYPGYLLPVKRAA